MRKPLCFLTAVYCFSKKIRLRFLKNHQHAYWLISVFLIIFGLCCSTYASAQEAELKKLSDEDKRVKDILHQYDQKLFFTQNKGQWDNMVLYKVDFKFGQAIATQNGMLMGTYDPKSMSDIYQWADKGEENMHKGIPFNEEKPELKGHNWLMHFLQASPKMTIEAKEAHEDKFSYFMEREESKYAALTSNYQEIWYKNVYDKVDVRYYPSEEGHLEYDIICKPGFSKEQIAVQFDGIDYMEVDYKGNLVLKTSVQDVQLPAPYAYQVINGVKNKIEIQYTIDKNVLTFQIGDFDKSAPLIIDPIALRWASWLTNNSAGDNHGHGVWVDESDGAIYVLARIVGNGLITTVGAYQTSSAGNLDIVVGKYLEPSDVNQSGTRVWQTYLGGSSDDNPYALEMGEDGNIYITGYTNSSNFPLLGGTAFNGTGASLDNRSQSTSNIFVTKINKAGNSIKSAVIGGNGGSEQSYDLRTTKTDVLVCGQTNSTNLATLYPGSGATNSNAGGTDVLIFKINQNLTAVSWMSNYGGSGDDRANIMLSNPINGDIFVAGQTASSNFPTLNARQTSRGGTQAGFLQKLSLSGVTAWRSYFSSASSASASILCMEFNTTKDKLYFGGLTTGLAAANISSSGVYDNSLNGGTDLFVCRMDTGQLFNMSTYLGGTSSEDNMMGLNTDANNDVYVFAYTPSTNFPVTADALQSSNQGQSDKTFSKLNANLNALLFSTYYGGSSEDYDPVGERGIKFANCRIYTLVTAQSNNIPLTQNALTTNKLSSTSIYEPGIVIWANPPDLLGNSITPNQQICLGATPANMTGSVPAYSVPTIVRNGTTYTYPPITTPITYQWQISTDSINWTNIAGAIGQNLNGNMIGPVFQNTYIRRIISGDACVLSGASDQIISLKILALSGTVTPVTCAPDRNGAINLTVTNGTVPYSYLWNDGVITKDRSGLSAGTYSVTVTDAHGCSAIKFFDVVNSSIKPEIVATAVPPILCNGQTSLLSFSPANDIQTVNWYNGCGALGAFLGNTNTVNVSPLVNSQYSVIIQSTSGCKDTACVSVMIENTPPVITNVPSNLNVSCSSDVPQADISTITVTDNSLGNITVTVQDVISNQTCANRYTITRTWTATDVCGNAATSTQTITVDDQTAPTITGTPQNITVSCAGDVPTASINSVTATDNCAGIVSVSIQDAISNQTCANRYTITRTWTATDVCGNAATSTQTITVDDQTAPTISGTPQNITVSCTGDVPTASINSVTATDNCAGTVSVTVQDAISNQTCANRYTITRTWTATDVCGNAATSTQTITVDDQTAPTITGTPQNITVSCAGDVPTASISSVTATDNCAGTVSVTVQDAISNQTCANRYTITRTWTATDVCGKAATSTQTITVDDQTAPTISGTPQNITVSCASDVPQASISSVIATDNCAGTVSVTVQDAISNETCANRYTITRTWTATDVCGNVATSTQIITVDDETAPIITGTPQNITVSCAGDVPTASISSVTATDNCAGTVSVTVQDAISNQTCANRYTITRTWTATDVCGNATTSIQIITVDDETAPTITGTPESITVSCASDVPTASISSVNTSDNCAGIVSVSVQDAISNQTCANRYTITRTWTATDVCGNSSTSSQIIFVNGQTAPSITGTPEDITVSCSSDVPEASINAVTTSANCSGSVTVTVQDAISNQTCANRYTITRTWTATDVCGNNATTSQTITVDDETAPTISGTPEDITVSCASDVPTASINSVTATDNCAGIVNVSVQDAISNQTCANRYTITRTWTATDVCGNTATSTQTITVDDETAPTITGTPEEITVSCASDVPAASIYSVTATDNCAGTVSVTVQDAISNQTCANRYTITRTWTATDVCGNTATSTQIITADDENAPTITGTPQNITVSCASDVPPALISSIGISDNCVGNIDVSVSDHIDNQTCLNRYTITRTWTATDVCGNAATFTQTITVDDEIAPTISGTPEDITVSCAGDVPTASINSVTATDNCAGTVSVTVQDVIGNQTCANRYTITRTWTATDVCGNAATSTQIITVNDTIAPQFTETLPADITVCESIPSPSILHATDNCGNAGVVFRENSDSQTIPGSVLITRTWTATDTCGNSISHTQIIIVHPIVHTANNFEICDDASVLVGNHTYTESGIYNDTIPTIWGCDSIITTTLVVRNKFLTIIDTAICQGGNYVFNDKTYSASGNYEDTLHTFYGCDSIFAIHLTVKPLPQLNLHVIGNVILCANQNQIMLSANNQLEQYVWTKDGNLLQGTTSSSITITQGGLYQLTGQLNGCQASDSIRIIPADNCPQTDTITICIPAKTDTAFCVNQYIQLPDAVMQVSFCKQPNAQVQVQLIDTTCLSITATNVDALMDTFCILYCDNIGLCDTLIVFFCSSKITVPPIAENDCIETTQNTAVNISVTANDHDPDGHPFIVTNIVKEPLGGHVVINNNIITYSPQPDFCGKDTFWYELCDNFDGCDTAYVCIQVNCECELPQVITPNGDGYNDALVIPCIKGIDHVRLSVWNRWGLPVYENENYQNNWEGTYGGEPLPSGTYWYGIDFIKPDDGRRIKLANYLLIIK